MFIAVHGDKSSKDDVVIQMFAEQAVKKGYMVLSFDLPGLGERSFEDERSQVLQYINDFQTIMNYAKDLSTDIYLFAT